MKLKNIAEVRTGLTMLRKKAERFSEDIYKYNQLNLKCLDGEGNFYIENIDIFESQEKLDKKYFTAKDDIIVRLREPVSATLINETSKNLLIPSYFAIIRIKDNQKFKPEYIEANINSSLGKRFFAKFINMSGISILKSYFLKDFEILNTTLKKQETFIKILKLKKREFQLIEGLKTEREKFYKYIENKILNGEGYEN
ncbi:MAG: hypothetical protein M0R46_12150 [Candidatus Muirbacterium halophilum]|nr:hypothetical protein [Candidatus Muirbacterium halophilum]MCK9476668.1 hypothetical protein [Candidatus Muirbacterium halophilum]